jgi:hypothetical protein
MDEGIRNGIEWLNDLVSSWQNLPVWGPIVIAGVVLLILGYLTQRKR